MSENGNSIFRVPITRDSRWNHKNTLKYDQTRVTYCKYIAIYIYIFFLSFFFLSPYLDNLDGDGKRRRTFSLEGRKEKKKGVESRVDSKLEEIEPVRFRCHIRRCEKKKKGEDATMAGESFAAFILLQWNYRFNHPFTIWMRLFVFFFAVRRSNSITVSITRREHFEALFSPLTKIIRLNTRILR